MEGFKRHPCARARREVIEQLGFGRSAARAEVARLSKRSRGDVVLPRRLTATRAARAPRRGRRREPAASARRRSSSCESRERRLLPARRARAVCLSTWRNELRRRLDLWLGHLGGGRGLRVEVRVPRSVRVVLDGGQAFTGDLTPSLRSAQGRLRREDARWCGLVIFGERAEEPASGHFSLRAGSMDSEFATESGSRCDIGRNGCDAEAVRTCGGGAVVVTDKRGRPIACACWGARSASGTWNGPTEKPAGLSSSKIAAWSFPMPPLSTAHRSWDPIERGRRREVAGVLLVR